MGQHHASGKRTGSPRALQLEECVSPWCKASVLCLGLSWALSMPVHVGRYCCVPVQALPAPYNTELAELGYVGAVASEYTPYAAIPPAPCSMLLGVHALLLVGLNLTGKTGADRQAKLPVMCQASRKMLLTGSLPPSLAALAPSLKVCIGCSASSCRQAETDTGSAQVWDLSINSISGNLLPLGSLTNLQTLNMEVLASCILQLLCYASWCSMQS